jgi:hypothetical protein
MNQTYPNLDEFFGTYFHQDWNSDAASAREIVENYLREWPAEGVAAARTELEKLLSEVESESELGRCVQQLGCYYNPPGDGLTYRAWLEQVARVLSTGVN